MFSVAIRVKTKIKAPQLYSCSISGQAEFNIQLMNTLGPKKGGYQPELTKQHSHCITHCSQSNQPSGPIHFFSSRKQISDTQPSGEEGYKSHQLGPLQKNELLKIIAQHVITKIRRTGSIIKKKSYEKLTHLIFTCFKVRKHFFCELSKEATCPCAGHTDRELNAACK